MADVFISYKREERAKAEALAEAIAAKGYSVWWDVDLLPGNRWTDEIEAVIHGAKAGIVLWSISAIDSKWVRAEAHAADERGILIQAQLDGVQPPFGLRESHAYDLTNWTGATDDPLLAPILLAIERKAGPPPGPPPDEQAVTKVLDRPRDETLYWLAITTARVQRAESYETYLELFAPEPLFASLAHEHIAILRKRKTPMRWLPQQAKTTITVAASTMALLVGGVQLWNFWKERTLQPSEEFTEFLPRTVAPPEPPESLESPTSESANWESAGTNEAMTPVDLSPQDEAGEQTTNQAQPEADPWKKFTNVEINTLPHETLIDEVLKNSTQEILHTAAENGDESALAISALLYRYGHDGIRADLARAKEHLEQSCGPIYHRSCTILGYMYRKGTGVIQSYSNAAKYYKPGCDFGNEYSCVYLGYLYEMGYGVDRNSELAASLYQIGCDKAVPLGCHNLALSYHYGRGVPRNRNHSAELFTRACALGQKDSCGFR